MGKPRLERRPSITDNDADSDVDFEADATLEAPLPEFSLVTEVDRKSAIKIEKRQWQSPRERLETELRKLDGFWSFKPIPRDATLVGQTSRATLTPASSPRGSEVYLPPSPSPLEVTYNQYGFSGEDANSSEGRREPQDITELVDLGLASQHWRSRLAIAKPVWIPQSLQKAGVLDKYSVGEVSKEEIVAKDHASESIYVGTGKLKGVKRGGHV